MMFSVGSDWWGVGSGLEHMSGRAYEWYSMWMAVKLDGSNREGNYRQITSKSVKR